MTLTATSRIEGIALLQHHDLVTVPPERTESATASERYAARHLTETAISGQAPMSRPANLPVPAECNGPGNLPGTHRVKASGRPAAAQRATAAQKTGGGMQPDGRATHRRPCRFHEPALTTAGCPGRESGTGEKHSAAGNKTRLYGVQ